MLACPMSHSWTCSISCKLLKSWSNHDWGNWDSLFNSLEFFLILDFSFGGSYNRLTAVRKMLQDCLGVWVCDAAGSKPKDHACRASFKHIYDILYGILCLCLLTEREENSTLVHRCREVKNVEGVNPRTNNPSYPLQLNCEPGKSIMTFLNCLFCFM